MTPIAQSREGSMWFWVRTSVDNWCQMTLFSRAHLSCRKQFSGVSWRHPYFIVVTIRGSLYGDTGQDNAAGYSNNTWLWTGVVAQSCCRFTIAILVLRRHIFASQLRRRYWTICGITSKQGKPQQPSRFQLRECPTNIGYGSPVNQDQRLTEEDSKLMSYYLQHVYIRPFTKKVLGDHSLNVCYISQHVIWQRCWGGSRLRVVFNVTRPTTFGHCLNEPTTFGHCLSERADQHSYDYHSLKTTSIYVLLWHREMVFR